MIASETTTPIDAKIEGAARALTTLAPMLPTREQIDLLFVENKESIERGYFLPDEDEKIRELFSIYLTTRAALFSVLDDLRPFALQELSLIHI